MPALAKNAFALRHLDFEDLGLLRGLLDERGIAGHEIDAAKADLTAPEIAEADLLIVLGGPQAVYDDALYPHLRTEMKLIEQRLALGKPVLGICLGHQMIAHVLGAEVAKTGGKEIGYAPIEATSAGIAMGLGALNEADRVVLHWHGDNAELPSGALRLARTDFCPNQAFAYGSNVLGLQFHWEVPPARIGEWLKGHAGELREAGLVPDAIAADAARFGPVAAAYGLRFFGDWLDRILGVAADPTLEGS